MLNQTYVLRNRNNDKFSFLPHTILFYVDVWAGWFGFPNFFSEAMQSEILRNRQLQRHHNWDKNRRAQLLIVIACLASLPKGSHTLNLQSARLMSSLFSVTFTRMLTYPTLQHPS
jgi:hypothetical protein